MAFETPKRTRSSKLLTLISFRKLFRFRACNETRVTRAFLASFGRIACRERKREKKRANPICPSVPLSMLPPPTIHSVNVFRELVSKNVYMQHTAAHPCQLSPVSSIVFRCFPYRDPLAGYFERSLERGKEDGAATRDRKCRVEGWMDGWMDGARTRK